MLFRRVVGFNSSESSSILQAPKKERVLKRMKDGKEKRTTISEGPPHPTVSTGP